ncbi:succinate dehydrogenase cytochrome b subunit [bacterium]|nr:succinate dehydrogenase cytochrome b subunit [bacterium]
MSTVATSRSSTVVHALTKTSLGQKYLMAVSGLVALLFVIGHMVGNLQIFLGQDQINHYAETLQNLGPLLWVIRGFLILFILIHIWEGIKLKLENVASRPEPYSYRKYRKASLASRTMIWTGLIIASFVGYHLAHFTVQATNPAFKTLVDAQGRHDVYSMMILGFQNVWVSLLYIIAIGLLCYHLSHGVTSMFQSMGLNKPETQPTLDKIGLTLSVILFLGYISIPLSILAGIVNLPKGGM